MCKFCGEDETAVHIFRNKSFLRQYGLEVNGAAGWI